MANTKGLEAIKIDTNGEMNETDLKIMEHRRKKWESRLLVVLIAIAIVLLIRLIYALGSYDNYDVRTHAERGASTASRFESFHDNIIEYSNDGIVYMTPEGELIWNLAFEMISPAIDFCGDYLVIYDRGGSSLYIMTVDGLQKSLDMGRTIRKACIANQGTIAVLMKKSGNSYISLYDKEGNELASGEMYAKEGYLTVDIALSTDATKLAVDSIDITNGKMDSLITFYNFGTVGREEIDNKVCEYSYPKTVFPEIDFVSANKLLAISDNGFVVFEGTQKPEPTRDLIVDYEIESVFHNSKYVGIVYPNDDEENSRHIVVYDLKGSSVMENKTTLGYEEIYFLDNNEVCVRGNYACEIYTIQSIKKFSCSWDTEIYKILDNGILNDYILLYNGGTEQIRLK